MAIKQLRDDQLQAFDTEYVTDALWKILARHIDATWPDGGFRFLDIGGGNGCFADRLLAAYPQATGTVLDNSQLLLGKNTPNPRKTLLLESAARLQALDGKYDLICFNWVLHHLVDDDYAGSVRNITDILHNAARLLADNGRISIFENIYRGMLLDNAPSHIIFGLTSAKPIARLIRRMGANTAGTGVCFQSRTSWERILRNAGVAAADYAEDSLWPIPWSWRTFLHVGNIRCGNFWSQAVPRTD